MKKENKKAKKKNYENISEKIHTRANENYVE